MPRYVRDDGTCTKHHNRYSALYGGRRCIVCNMSEEEQRRQQQ